MSQPGKSEYRLPKADAGPAILSGAIVIVFLLGGFGAWAALAPISSAIVAGGEVVVKGEPKAVQHLEGGIVAEILVEDGDWVAAGDPLIRLDITRTEAEARMLRSFVASLQAKEARLAAEIAEAETIAFPQALLGRQSTESVRAVLAEQREQFRQRRAARDGEIGIYRQKIIQLQAQREALQAARDAAEAQIHIYHDELAGLRALHAKGYYPQNRIRERERDVARLSGEVGSKEAEIARTGESIGEAELRILQTGQTFRSDAVAERASVRDRLREMQDRLIIAEDTLARNLITAPTSGTVQEIAVHTVGGVIAPGDALMKIVPAESELLISAEVAPTDIDAVREGQSADIHLTALKARVTPVLIGQVEVVSTDRIEDVETRRTFFKATIRVPLEQLDRLGDRKLRPGMPVQVFIRVGERTFFDYLLKPLSDGMARAFREV